MNAARPYTPTAYLLEPLETKEPTSWVLIAEGLPMEDLIRAFGVIAVASGRFSKYGHDKRDHGPHEFTVVTDSPEILEAPDFRGMVAHQAGLQAWRRCDQGALTKGIRSGELWPLANVSVERVTAGEIA